MYYFQTLKNNLMKKTILCLLLLPLAAFAQSPKNSWLVRPHFSVENSRFTCFDDWTHNGYYSMAITAYSYGADLGYRIGDFHITTGLTVQEWGGRNDIMGHFVQTEEKPRVANIIEEKQRTHSVPLNVGYFPKWVYIQAGVSSNWVTYGHRRCIWDDPNDPNGMLVYSEDPLYDKNEYPDMYMNDHYWSLQVSAGLNAPVCKKVNITLGATLKRTLSTQYVDAYDVNSRFLNVGGTLGIVYYFNLKK
jgi:hypothetical protein